MKVVNKTVFVTFGWTEIPVISSILRYGLNEGDRIVVILPEYRDERSQRALNDLETFISNYVKNVEITKVYINLEDIADSIYKLKSCIENEKGRKCIVNLSGGMRSIVIITYIATILAKHPDIMVELETEDRKRIIEIPEIKPEDLRKFEELSYLAKEIIKELLFGPLEAAVLRKKLNAAASSFHNAQMKLVEMGYIEREKKNKSSILKLTTRGKILAKLLIRG